jgi:hypothetical protein
LATIGVIYMAWKGIEGDDRIWWSTFDGEAWDDQHLVLGAGTIDGPASVPYLGRLFLFWKGLEGDNTVWFSSRGPGHDDL